MSKEEGHGHQHSHGHSHADEHGHVHGAIDPSIATTERGIWALKWSFAGLMVTALFQVVVVWYTGSVALLADTIHNFGDAATAVPLWIAFMLARRKPSKRFTYGYGRAEDLAGLLIVLMILASAVVAAYQSVQRLLNPEPVEYVWALIIASIVGFLGNEGVAIFRIKVGKEIGSAALVADGYHARTDGLTSLAVLFGAIGVYFGYPIADPIVGLIITLLILKIVWESARLVFTRLLDGADPEIIDEIASVAVALPNVEEVTEVRVRWIGHRLHGEVNLAVDPKYSVQEAHDIAIQAQHALVKNVPYLASATIHIDPVGTSGERHHK